MQYMNVCAHACAAHGLCVCASTPHICVWHIVAAILELFSVRLPKEKKKKKESNLR